METDKVYPSLNTINYVNLDEKELDQTTIKIEKFEKDLQKSAELISSNKSDLKNGKFYEYLVYRRLHEKMNKFKA